MNIAEILKNAPKGTKLYSPIFGNCELFHVYGPDVVNGGCIQVKQGETTYSFGLNGSFKLNGECLLFPSKEQRDWSQFRILRVFKPFDKVVVRDTDEWHIDLFEQYDREENLFYCLQSCWKECLPYNEHTEKLIGTTDDFMG
jgi:hypothetical protein